MLFALNYARQSHDATLQNNDIIRRRAIHRWCVVFSIVVSRWGDILCQAMHSMVDFVEAQFREDR